MARKKLYLWGAGALGVLFLIFGSPYYTARTVEATVTGKERIDGEESYYLVYTQEETFKNVDSRRRLKMSSSDLQGQLVEGRRYRLHVYGARIPLFSSYRNIVSVESLIEPSVAVSRRLEELGAKVAEVADTGRPHFFAVPQRLSALELRALLERSAPEGALRVFGREASELWGVMLYSEDNGVVIDAAPLELGVPFPGTEEAAAPSPPQ